MLPHRWSRVVRWTTIIRREKWTDSRVSTCETHHVRLKTKQPLYSRRFQLVLPFHLPGLAPVIDQTGAAAHIDDRGDFAYSQRFSRTFGFYQHRAAVHGRDDDHWYHIKPNGSPAYESRWQWCGNFQSDRCTVRDVNQAYYHIDRQGRLVSGPHSYAGDFREGSAVVRSSIDGLFRAVDENGRSLHSTARETSFFDLDVYHKGLARARDEGGWLFIDRAGLDTGQGRRYRQLENFYNGQALVQLLHDGSRCIIDEQHRVVARLDDCHRENQADLEQIAKSYWPAFALKLGLEHETDLLQLDGQIQRAWSELGLLQPSAEDERTYTPTKRGRLLLDSESITRDRARYWLQDRYISAWLPTLIAPKVSDLATDTFTQLAKDPDSVALSQRVLNSYADQDWHGIASILPRELFRASAIVDLAGGMGALLRELSPHCSQARLICIDRPEVVRLAEVHPAIEFRSGDLFTGPLPPADFYLLSRVLHDWSDEKVKMILNRIPASALCVIDREVDSRINQHALLSLHMFLINGARERTRQEWNDLLAATDWEVQSRTLHSNHIVTLLKKSEKKKKIPMVSATPSSTPQLSVRKLVLPVAGLGTRMRPQSFLIPKVLLPIVQRNADAWQCRPVLDLLLEGIFAGDTGIEQVLCVIAPEQSHRFQSYLSSLSHQHPIRFIIQASPKGFGHAVLQAEDFIDNEPFVVMLGDHLYRSHDNATSCLSQLLKAYRKHALDRSDIGLTGVMTCAQAEISDTGLLQCDHSSTDPQFFKITDMVEKPSLDVAIRRFRSSTFNERFLCHAGIDILPPAIFSLLRQQSGKSELGLREAMNDLRLNGQLYGCLLSGDRYDIGNPKEYYRTFQAFATERAPRLRQQQHAGVDPWALLQQIERVRALFLSSQTPIYIASAPGRLDVLGGFADYSGSHVLQYPLAQRTYAFVQASPTETVRMISVQTDSLQSGSIDQSKCTLWERMIPANLLLNRGQTLRLRLQAKHDQQPEMVQDESGHWPNYIMGILAELISRREATSIPTGFNITIISDVPCNRGVASSAALEVSVARAASACLNLDGHISDTELALLCQYVENHVVGGSCGFMDQMTCAHARDDHLFSLLCQRTPHPPFHHVTLPSTMQLIGIDSGVKRSTTSSAYQRVRAAAFIGKQMMHLPSSIQHLCEISPSQFNQLYRSLLPDSQRGDDVLSSGHLDPLSRVDPNEVYPVRAATAHPIEENFRVQLFEQLLTTADHPSHLGELMFQSDAGYTACQVHSEETCLLVDLVRRKQRSSPHLLYGAKITGGGSGGTVAVLARNSLEATDAIQTIVDQYETATRRRTRLFSGSSPGLVTYPSRTFLE